MQATPFSAIHQTGVNTAFQSIFQRHWPAYKSWYQAKKQAQINPVELKKSVRALKNTMPELLPTYQQLLAHTGDDPVAAQFLTLHQPPAYLINCSQVVLTEDEPVLIRNYDLSPDLSENLITHSQFGERRIIGTNECLWGFDDGMNEAGLVVSLTFGGRKVVGDGFGIPLILRYVLETCETVAEGVAQLKRIPSHMAYNVTLLDKSGRYATVLVSPDREAVVLNEPCATNHPQQVEWPEQAAFSRTVERKQHLQHLLSERSMNARRMVQHFLQAPLRSDHYEQNFGTVYTAEYRPLRGEMTYHWPKQSWRHDFANFKDQQISVQLDQHPLGVTGKSRRVDKAATPLEEMQKILGQKTVDWASFGQQVGQIWGRYPWNAEPCACSH